MSANVIDECTESLFSDSDQDNSKIFRTAEGEALDFLVAEAYITFEKMNISLQARQKKNSEVAHAMKVGTSIRRRSSLFKSNDKETLTAIMGKILADAEYLTVFKIYVLGVDAENLLYAYIEAVEIREKLSHFSRDVEEDISMQVFLHYVNGFYDTYLALGAPFKVSLAEATHGDFMRRVNKCKHCNVDTLTPIIEECFETLVREHLDRFLSTTEYRQLVRSGRRSVVALTNNLKKPVLLTEEEELRRKLSLHAGVQGVCDSSLVDEESKDESVSDVGQSASQRKIRGSVIAATALDISNPSKHLNELKTFILSSYNGIFGAFLESHDKLPLMYFYQSTARFASTTFFHSMERISESSNIFDRYISRSSDEQVGLPEPLRSDIVRMLFKSPLDIFSKASLWVLQTLYDDYWTVFKMQVLSHAVDEGDGDGGLSSKHMREFLAPLNPDGANECSSSSSESSADSAKNVPLDCFVPGDIIESAKGDGRSSKANGRPKSGSNEHRLSLFKDPAASIRKKSLTTDDMPEFARLAARRFPILSCQKATYSTSIATDREAARRASRANIGSFRKLFVGKILDKAGRTDVQLEGKNDGEAASVSVSERADGLSGRALRRFSLDKSSAMEEAGTLRPHHRRNSIGAPRIAMSDATTGLLRSQSSLRRLDSNIGSGRSSLRMVKEVLLHPQCCSIFKEYLERESAPQTLLFILEIEEFRRIPQAALQRLRARKIFNKFLHDMAILPLPVSEATRAAVASELVSSSFSIFKVAAEEVLTYIEVAQFPCFAKSPDMKRVEAILRSEVSSTKHKRRQSISIDTMGIADTRSLRQILQNQTTTRYFKDFCNRIYVNESLFFWLDAEHYANLPGSEYMKRTAYKICRKFIFEKARMQINICHQTRAEVLAGLTSPQRFLFRRAQEEIFRLLEQDAMPKFLAGPEYRSMVSALESSQLSRARSPIPGVTTLSKVFGLGQFGFV